VHQIADSLLQLHLLHVTRKKQDKNKEKDEQEKKTIDTTSVLFKQSVSVGPTRHAILTPLRHLPVDRQPV